MINFDKIALDMLDLLEHVERQEPFLGGEVQKKAAKQVALARHMREAIIMDSKIVGYLIVRLTDEGAAFSSSLRFYREESSSTCKVTPLICLPDA